MLDGKSLLDLDRWATINQVSHVGECLAGLRLEFRYNQEMLQIIHRRIAAYLQEEKNPLPIERLRTAATSHYICRGPCYLHGWTRER